MDKPIKIASHHACIGYDSRYMDYVAVFLNPDHSVTILVSSTAPIGGMDGDPTPTPMQVDFNGSTGPKAKPNDVIKLLRRVLRNERFAFAKYGKCSKKFNWLGVGLGVNTALCKQALDKAKSVA